MSSEGLTAEELGRYARHLMLPELGVEGQKRLKTSSVLCVGAGGLGSSLLLYLAAAGFPPLLWFLLLFVSFLIGSLSLVSFQGPGRSLDAFA